MAPEKDILDQGVRDLVTGDLATTYLLEAGAGSGKTRVLVDRYVTCVLDPERGAGDVAQVAAITFTEKAAGELRQRVREEFERRARAAAEGSDELEVIERSLDGLDDAPINTIHGFAGRLLREFPVEAGIDPAFEQLDGLGSEIELARLWELWLTELAAGDDEESAGRAGAGGIAPAHDGLSRLLRAGVTLDDVRKLAADAGGVFGERYDVDLDVTVPDEPVLADDVAALGAPLASLREFCAAACLDESDRGFAAAITLVDECERLLADTPAGVDWLATKLFLLPVKTGPAGPGGNKTHWSAAHGGKDALLESYAALSDPIVALRERYATYLTETAVAVACAFARWAGERMLEAGKLDFADLLGRLRDLLVRDRAARAALQKRFRFLLVDEFQDTDPLQAEIVFFLCERAPTAADRLEVELEPGKLFVVGDPKQSIYRFRRADIAMYDEVKDLIGRRAGPAGRVEELGQNFRTTPGIVRWVNDVFGDVFVEEPGRQPAYGAVTPYREPIDGPAVSVLLGASQGSAAGAAAATRRSEARALAALLCRMHGDERDRWEVRDQGAMRAPRWGDVALLFRVTTDLETYEQALREAGVPYRVDGGKSYFSRREVDDTLLCLRAIDDPSDGPAVYGALHSSLFGFSDDDLYLFFSDGGRFDPFVAAQPPHHAAIAAALGVLGALHTLRAEREPHELTAELVRRVHATEFLAATGSGAGQAIANLEKLVERARAFTEAGGGGLGEFLAWAAQAGDSAGESESQVDDDADVVHLLTIHKAKGLEYPIVMLVGGGLSGGGGKGEPIVDRERRRVAVKLKAALPGAAPRDLEPRRYLDLKEREKLMSESEARRLLYVAATRARDRLVLCCFGELLKKDGNPRAVMLGPIAGRLPEPAQIEAEYVAEDLGGLLVLPPGAPPARGAPGPTPEATTLVAARGAWRERREQVLEIARRPARATSPSGLEHVDEDVRRGGPGAPAGRSRALALGSAVHRIMELCDLDDEASLTRVAHGVALELGRDDLVAEAVDLARACWRAAPVRAAAVAAAADPGVAFRELPIGVLLGDIVVSGTIDLLYRDGDQWVIVDYKTDRLIRPDTLRERYAPQGAAYAVAIEFAIPSAVVREVSFIAARSGGVAVTIPVDDALREAVRREAEAAVVEGRALVADHPGPAAGAFVATDA